MSENRSQARGDGQHVLVVVEDAETTELLATTMELAGYRVSTVSTGAEAMVRLVEHRFDLVVLDVTLPDLQGLSRGSRFTPADRPPVLFLTAYQTLGRLVPELGAGGEDYVTKPFRIAEVLARAEVLLRDHGPVREGPSYGDLVLDDDTCQAWRGQREIGLTPRSTDCCGICWSTPSGCCPRSRSAVMCGARVVPTTRSRSSSPGCGTRWTGKVPR